MSLTHLPQTILEYRRWEESLHSLNDSLPRRDMEKVVRQAIRQDLFYLLKVALKRPDMDHPWIFDRCREIQENPDGYIDVWAREHYKSTIISYGLSIHDILTSHGNNPDPKWDGIEQTIGFLSYNRPLAKAFLRQCKVEFETNELLRDIFPDILWRNPHKDAPKWSEDDGIVLKRRSNPREATMEAWGLVDSQPTGKHFTTRVYDDAVTQDSVVTPATIQKTTDRWELSLNLGTRKGRARYVGTYYHDLDTYRVMESRGIPARKYPCTKDGTATGEPVLISPEALAEKRRTMGPYNFSCQMLLDPVPGEEGYFQRAWFQFYGRMPDGLRFYMASDYATLDGRGDYTVFGVMGVDDEGTGYIVDWWRAQVNTGIWSKKGVELYKKWEPAFWAEEKGAIQKSVRPLLVEELSRQKVVCRFEEFTSVHNKPTRQQAAQALIADGRIRFPVDAPWLPDLLHELLRFPKGKDDQADVIGLFGRMIEKVNPTHLRGADKRHIIEE